MAQFFKPNGKGRKKSPPSYVLTGTADALDHQGRGVVRISKQGKSRVYFVPQLLPGETAQFKVTGQQNIELLARQSTAAERRQAPCPYYDDCGGCDLQHINETHQRRHKQQVVTELFAKMAGMKKELPWHDTLIADDWQYRRKARLAIYQRATKQPWRLGFRAHASKHIVDIPQCAVLDSELNRLITDFRKMLDSAQLGPKIGHVELIKAPAAQLCLRITQPLSSEQTQQLEAFSTTSECAVWLDNGQQLKALSQNAICFDETIDGDRLVFMPGDFIQVNARVNQQMVKQAVNWLAPQADDEILDLFAGIGNFTLPLARRAKSVTAVEGVSAMTKQLAANATTANLSNVYAHTFDLGTNEVSRLLEKGYQRILLDPARAGAEAVCQCIAKLQSDKQPEQIVYVSCSPDTLARDSRWLLDNGYEIAHISLVDMFVQTHHIETMVSFKKVV
ncbi:23S rRNA (uracil(1939)-C(5))-methyltransferase RlmD [Idiomarina sp.]|uniref:23S rRNA (uracil(1939)-C(5))-methyltransferase RlmD n=2 Tax=unclassified Idiomarina TaxID=2614829 RepID=UPI0025BBFE29|nr:23S rRNA (uracil(1939)-C(5))-methyltransferase RlmD [Idiomarina sp.]NQZ03905.1 23S rRNA (uracil(1939)-C(5))-methyltransferase RlmD [Idiomarina sp.]